MAATSLDPVRRHAAVAVLEALVDAPGAATAASFEAWSGELCARVSAGGECDGAELLVLMYVLRQAGADTPGLKPRGHEFALPSESLSALAETVALMRRRLLRQSGRASDRRIRRLPKWFLARQPRDVQAIHAAIFSEPRGGPSAAVRDLLLSYVPRPYDALVLAVAAAACLHPLVREIAAGMFVGHVLGSLIEHTFHKRFGHASPRQQARMARVLGRFGVPGRLVLRSAVSLAFSHGAVHHASYARNYVDRFAPGDRTLSADDFERERLRRKARIDVLIAAREPAERADIVRSDYGVALSHAVQDAFIVMPFVALAAWLLTVVFGLLGAAWSLPFIAAAAAVSLLFLPASNYIHPYLHMTRAEAFARAGVVMRWLLRSRYVQHIAQAHYVHHRDPSVNQNLVPGADFLLGYRPSRLAAVLALRRLDTFL